MVHGYAGEGEVERLGRNASEDDLKRLNLYPSMATDRELWRRLVRVSVWPVLAGSTTLND